VVLHKAEESKLDRSYKEEEALHRVKVERNTLHTTRRRKAKGIGHTRLGKCLLKEVIEGTVEGKRRRRRCRQLLDDLKEKNKR
jgi:hypothetical protein